MSDTGAVLDIIRLKADSETLTRKLLDRCKAKVEENTLLQTQLRLSTDEKNAIQQTNTQLEKTKSAQSKTINEIGQKFITITNEFKDYRTDCEKQKRTLSGNVGGLQGLNQQLFQESEALHAQIAELKSKTERAKIKLNNLKVRQEVFKGGRSTSPSDIIYRGKKFIRGKLMKEQAETEQKAREDARVMFLRGIQDNPPPEFSNQSYYSTSPAVRRFMRKIKDETDDEKQAKQARDEFRKARHAKRFELTP